MTEVVDDFVMNLKEMKEDELGMNNKTSEIKETEEIESKGSTKQKLTPLEQTMVDTIYSITEKDMIMLDITPETSVEEAYEKIIVHYPSVAEVLKKEVFAPLGIPTKFVKDNKIDVNGLMQFIYERELAKEDSKQQGSGRKRLRSGEEKPSGDGEGSGSGGGDGGEVYNARRRGLFRRTLTHLLAILSISCITLTAYSFVPASISSFIHSFVSTLSGYDTLCETSNSAWYAGTVADFLGIESGGCLTRLARYTRSVNQLYRCLTGAGGGISVTLIIFLRGQIGRGYRSLYNFIDYIIQLALERLEQGVSLTNDSEDVQIAIEQFIQDTIQDTIEDNENPDVDESLVEQSLITNGEEDDIDPKNMSLEVYRPRTQGLVERRRRAQERTRERLREFIGDDEEQEQKLRESAQEFVSIINDTVEQVTQFTDGEVDIAEFMTVMSQQDVKRPRREEGDDDEEGGGAAFGAAGYKNKSKKSKKSNKTKKSKKSKKSKKTRKSRK